MSSTIPHLEILQKAHQDLKNRRIKIDRAWKVYEPVFSYIHQSISEDQIIRAGFDIFGSPEAALTTSSISAGEKILADICRHCNLSILTRPSDVEFPRIYVLKPADSTEWPTFLLKITPKSCQRVQVGTKTVEQPIYEVRCEEEAEPHGQ